MHSECVRSVYGVCTKVSSCVGVRHFVEMAKDFSDKVCCSNVCGKYESLCDLKVWYTSL